MATPRDKAHALINVADAILRVVNHRASSPQWAEWLQVPLEHATASGDRSLVDQLLQAGANRGPGYRGRDGQTLLHAAAESGSEQLVTMYLDAGYQAEVDIQTKVTQKTALHLAAYGGHRDAARALIMAGADINKLDRGGCSALHHAILHGGDEHLATDLLLVGASPHVKDALQMYPLHYAAFVGQDHAVRALVRKRVDVNVRNNIGVTPLHTAAQAGHTSTVRLLLAAGANVDLRDISGNTPLLLAAMSDRPAVVETLVVAGAKIDAPNNNGETPLYLAAGYDKRGAMRALLEQGADVHGQARGGWQPLHIACSMGHPDAADLLLRWGADEKVAGNEGKTVRDCIPNPATVPEQSRPRVERLHVLLARAPQDRAWRRRGFLVLCRRHPERLQHRSMKSEAVDANTAAESAAPAVPPATARAASQGQWMGDKDRAKAAKTEPPSVQGADESFQRAALWIVVCRDAAVFRSIVSFL